MKIFVYHYPTDANHEGFTSCNLDHNPKDHQFLVQEIVAEETDLLLTEEWKGDGIEIGEVFQCNAVISNLIRVA